MTKKHLSLLVVLVMLFTSLFSSFAFAAEEEWVIADDITIKANYHVQTYGDRSAEGDGALTFGTSGEAKRLENISLELEGAPADMEIRYGVHARTYGDLPVDNGGFAVGPAVAGTAGEAKRLEGVKIGLYKKGTDELYPGYQISYQVHMRWYGWGANAEENWRKGNEDAYASNGEYAGTKGEGLRVEAISILIEKEAKFAVKDVAADNLKTVLVEFNREVDKDTVTSTTVKAVKGSSSVVDSLVLLDDNQTLAIVMTTRLQSDKIKLTIDGVKDLAGEIVEKYEEEFVLNDVTIPNLVNVRALNAKQLMLTFTEPVQMAQPFFAMWSNIEIDGAATVAKADLNNADNTVLLTLSNALSEGTHTIKVSDIKDYAQFVAPTKTFDITIVKDEIAPVAEEVIVKSRSEIVVKFNEPVEIPGSFRVDNQPITNIDWNAQKTEVTLKDLDLNISAIVEIKVEYKGQRDIMGNEVKDWKTIITRVADDASLPTVEMSGPTAGNKLTFTFSKPMQKTGKIQILNKDSKVIEECPLSGLSFKANSDNKVLEVKPSSLASVDPGDYFVKLVDLKDDTIRQNALLATTIAFKALDTKAPTVIDEYLLTDETDTDKDTITIYFSEPMDKATIENLGNYYVDGAPLTTDDNAVSAKATADGRSVVINYKKASTIDNLSVTVYAVKDLAGNMMQSTTPGSVGQVVTKLAVKSLAVTGSAIATDKNTIEVTFTTPVKTVDPSVFYLQEKADPNRIIQFVSATVKSGSTNTVVFKTATAMKTDTAMYKLIAGIPGNITNIYNEKLTDIDRGDLIDSSMVDKVRPEYVSVKSTTSNAFVITFSETIEEIGTEDLKNDLVIRYSDGSLVNNDKYTYDIEGDKLVITLEDSNKLSAGTNSVTVSLVSERYLQDKADNKAVPFEAKSVNVDVNFGN